MTHHLPPSLLALFAPRPPLPYLPPIEKKKCPHYCGISQFVRDFEDPKTIDYSQFKPIETKKQIKERRAKEKSSLHEEKIQKILAEWDPHKNEKATSDPYKTLFVSRISYTTSEHKLKREFQVYGPIKRICLVHDIQSGKFRGYAFVEFERKSDMQTAYKQADGKKIDGRRVLVDVERGRTVRNWRPRRLGGGLGATRAGGDDVNQKFSGREPPSHALSRERDTYRPDRKERGDRDNTATRERRDHKERDGRSRERERERDREQHRSRSREKSRERHRSRSRERHSHRR